MIDYLFLLLVKEFESVLRVKIDRKAHGIGSHAKFLDIGGCTGSCDFERHNFNDL